MNNPAVKWGLYYAGISVVLTLLMWLIDKSLLFSISVSLGVGILIPVIMMLMSNRATREEQEGYLSFGEGVRSSMLTFMIGGLIGSIFTWILINYIDPSLIETQKEVAMQSAESMAEMFGAPEEAMDEMKDEMEEAAMNPTLGQSLMGWGFSLIFPGLLISLIVSAITKKGD